jgi:glycosyltransferase involved in cell wall biosynthesis
MKIAQIAPLYEAVPPSLYGGTERIVAHLTNALVELGHDVTLFASAEAHTRATLVPVRDQAIRLDPFPLKSDLAAHLSMLHELHLRRHEFDLLHFHVDLIHFPFFEDLAARTVTTLHGRLDLKDLPEVYSRWHDYPLVSISDDQRKPLASANWLATIHHGVAEGVYSFNKMPSDPYLAFLGRIDARIEKIAERKQIVGLTINEIRVKDGWADLITRRKRKLSAARLRNAGLRLPRGPHVSSRGTRSQFDPPDVHSARAGGNDTDPDHEKVVGRIDQARDPDDGQRVHQRIRGQRQSAPQQAYDVLEDQQQAERDQKLIFLGAPIERPQQQGLDHGAEQRDHAGATGPLPNALLKM